MDIITPRTSPSTRWRHVRLLRLCLQVSSATASLVFASGFVMATFQPLAAEKTMREIIRMELEHRVGQKMAALDSAQLAALARGQLATGAHEIQRSEALLREHLRPRVAEVVSSMQDADCVCRQRLAGYIQSAGQLRLDSLRRAQDQLTALVEAGYASVTQGLLRDFRIFCASNALALGVLAVLMVRRKAPPGQLALTFVVVMGATGITGGLYLFRQDWLHTLLFGAYTGWLYPCYLVLVMTLLADATFNRARVTRRVLAAAGALGALLLPC